VVYRLSPENVRPPRGGPSGALAMFLVLGLAVGIWALAGGDPGSRTGGGPGDMATTMTEAPPTEDPVSGLPYVAPADLPTAALDLFVALDDVDAPQGVPFDDTARVLPAQVGTYYTEYALPPATAGAPGPQRLVVGRGGETYWTEDGGATFARVGP
jgi:hypothetical protein